MNPHQQYVNISVEDDCQTLPLYINADFKRCAIPWPGKIQTKLISYSGSREHLDSNLKPDAMNARLGSE